MSEFFVGIFTGILITLLIVGLVNSDTIWHKSIIEAGHGQYNTTTGKFEFLKPCKDK